MRETERIAELLEETFEGRAYYGKCVLGTLEGIGAEMAAQKPADGGNSIREIVVHMTLELDYHRKIIEGSAEKWVAGETTWDENGDYSDEAWEKTVEKLEAANRALVEAVERLPDDILDKEAVPLSRPFYRVLNGVLHHGIYHSGQISILKRQFLDKKDLSKNTK